MNKKSAVIVQLLFVSLYSYLLLIEFAGLRPSARKYRGGEFYV